MDRGLRWVLLVLIALNVVCAGLLIGEEERVDAPLAALDAKAIRLLTETAEGPLAVQMPATVASRPVSGPVTGDPIVETPRTALCMATGPFDSLNALRGLRDRIQSEGMSVRVLEEQVESDPDYLVYVSPAQSREVARRTYQELKGQAIDSYIIREGELADGVSVGLFSRRDLASAQRDRVAELGYDVDVRTLDRRHTVYRLLAQGFNGSGSLDEIGEWVPCDEIAAVDRIL